MGGGGGGRGHLYAFCYILSRDAMGKVPYMSLRLGMQENNAISSQGTLSQIPVQLMAMSTVSTL